VVGAIYRRRVQLAARLLEGVEPLREGRVLDAGCGAGPAIAALAGSGYKVHGTDAVRAMIELARAANRTTGSAPPTFSVADAEAMPFADGSFEAAVSLGLIPWVPDPDGALRELSRVVRPGGHLVMSADNRSRLTFLLDPWRHPAILAQKRRVKGILRRLGLRRAVEDVPPRMHRPGEFDAALARAGFEKVQGFTFGFGPFTVLGRPILGAQAGIRADGLLERIARAPGPWLRRRGNQYLVLARKI
jgi:ubiquinone/menaquinone biosynthesis C-methylase UbiE